MRITWYLTSTWWTANKIVLNTIDKDRYDESIVDKDLHIQNRKFTYLAWLNRNLLCHLDHYLRMPVWVNYPYTGTQQRYKTNVPWRQNPRLQIYVYFWWKHGTTKRSDTTVSCCGKFISSSSKTHVLRQKPFYKTHGLHRRSTRTHQPRYKVVVYGLQHRSSVHTHYKVHGIRFTIWTEIKTGRVNQEQTQHSTK